MDVFSVVCLFVCLGGVLVCLFVCQLDNFRTSKHRMMKLGVGALYKISAVFEFGGRSPRVRTSKNVALDYDIGKISAGRLVLFYASRGRWDSAIYEDSKTRDCLVLIIAVFIFTCVCMCVCACPRTN